MSLKIPNLGNPLNSNYDFAIGISQNNIVILTIKRVTSINGKSQICWYIFELLPDRRFGDSNRILSIVNNALVNSYKEECSIKFSFNEKRKYIDLDDGLNISQFTGRFYECCQFN